jgi:hypothetical protein
MHGFRRQFGVDVAGGQPRNAPGIRVAATSG